MATRKTTKTRTSRAKTPTTPKTQTPTTTAPATESQAGALSATMSTAPAMATMATSPTLALSTQQLAALNLAGAIEVGTRPMENIIVREGVEVKSPALSLTRVEAFVERLQPIIPFNTPRVVQQSVKPGSRVAKGATVDLVLVPPTYINLGLVENSHTAFQNMTVQAAAPIVQSARTLLDRRASAADLTSAEREQFQGILAQNNIPVDDQEPATSLDAAFRTLQGAKAYS